MRYDFFVRTREDLIEAIRTFGFVPYFSNSIPGFSLEEHCDPRALWSGNGDDSWAWKGPVIQATGCAYGKLFAKKAAYVSRAWFPDLANYRRDGYDFDARYEDGLAKHQDKTLYDLISMQAPVLSKELRRAGGYAYHGRGGKPDGKKGFDASMTRLQHQGYVIISDFVYDIDKHGNRRGWGVAQYDTPERFMGDAFSDTVYERTPEESYLRLMEQFRRLFPTVREEDLKRILK